MSKYKEQRDKVIVDLVDFAQQFKKVREHLSVSSTGLREYVLLDFMSDEILKTFTISEEGLEDVKETEA